MYASHVLPTARDYGALYRKFRWQVPARYNIGVDVCDRWAQRDPDRLALVNLLADGTSEEIRYGWLKQSSDRVAHALPGPRLARGDRAPHYPPPMPGAGL